MSHKTGKRVLTASTSLALAVVGLAASPIAAHAAAGDVTAESLCGKSDRIVVKDGTGLYYVKDAASDTVYTYDSGDPAVLDTGSTLSVVDSTHHAVTLPTAMWDASTPATGKLKVGYFMVDAAGNTVVTQSAFNSVTDATCPASASIPVPTMKSNVITVNKGEGLKWTLTVPTDSAGTTTVTATATATDLNGNNVVVAMVSGTPTGALITYDLVWPVGSSASSTQTIKVVGDDSDRVRLAATPDASAGYTGGSATYNFIPGAVQYAWVAPVANDRDGIASDTATVTPHTGVTYYYTTSPTLWNSGAPSAPITSGGSANVATLTGTNDAADETTAANSWIAVPAGASSFNRPPDTSPNYGAATSVYVVGVTASPYAWADTTTLKPAELKFTDTTKVASLPAPQTVNGDGPNDSYTLPSTAGVVWSISSAKLGLIASYNAGDSRLGQTVPVYTNGADTYTFTATPGTGYTWADGTTTAKTFTADYDSRYQVTPVGPSWTDQTGIVNDAVTFPAAYSGQTGYLFSLTTGAASPVSTPSVSATGQVTVPGTWFWVDASWYGKTIPLTDIQKIAGGGSYDPMTKTHVWVWTDANQTTSVLAKDAIGTDVKHQWDYNFTNANNIVPVAPTQSTIAGDTTSYTLTFPVDPKVIYSVTDANGLTKAIAYGDLGKPLTYSGTVTVTAKSAQPGVYVIQPDANGNAPAPWTFMAPSATIKPQAPTMSNPAGTANDTYTLPAQTGIVWNVDGKDVPLSAYGSPISTGGATKVIVIAQAGAGYALDSTAQAKWTLDFTDGPPTNVQIGDTKDSAASVPTTVFHWSADNATSYDITYHKTLLNGSAGPEIDWMMDTTATEAKFVAEPGDEYTVTVVAKNDNGDADAVSSTVKFDGGSAIGDVTSGQGTFSAGWNLLGKAQLSSLPYYGDTAALASNGATWTYTVPAGTKSFDLFATVHSLGAKGRIQVNGQNWADFETNPSYWGTVSNPYGYPVRRVQGWDNTKTATITVQQTEGGNLYLALDAYRVNK